MSMLVGAMSDGAALREGIIQQPGPFYNGNPSSIIWGTSPAAPLWRDESGSPFSSPGFGAAPPQQQHSEKERGGMGADGGRGPALRGRRHVTRAQMTTRNLSNPPAAPVPSSSPFAFGFPPPPVQSAEAEAAQDERMEDIEELLPGWAKLSVSDPPGDAQRTSIGAAAAQDFSRRFRTLDLNEPPAEKASMGRRASESGVFVFGAKGEAGKAAPAQNSSAPGARPRPVKVKRGGPAAKGKGIAAGGNLGAPSPIGPPPADRLASQAGECSFSHSRFSSQPLNLGGRPVGNAGYSSDDSISQGFAPFSPLAVSAREHASPDWGPHSPSSDAQSPTRRPGRPSFVFGEVGKDGMAKDGNLSGDSTTGGPGFPNVAESMIKASAMGGDSSSPAFRRRAHARRKGAGSSTRSGKQEFSSEGESRQAPFIEEASREFSLKLGLGSVSKEASSADGKFSKASGSGTQPNEEPPNEETANGAPAGGQRDAENPHPTASVPTKAVESAPEAKGPAIGAQKLSSSLPFLQLRPKAAPTSTPPDFFVFGGPRSEVPIPEAPFSPAPFKFASAGAVPSPPSSRSTTPRRGFRSRPVVKAAPSLPAFEQDESAASQSGTSASHPDADALSSSFLSLNFGTPKPPVNESSESEGVVPDPKTPSIPSLARDLKLKGDSEDPSLKNSSTSPFVFSAGKGSASSAEAKPEVTQGETKVPETPSAEDSPPASDASEGRSKSRPSNAREQSFEFRASGEFGVGSGKNAAAGRRKAHRTPASVSSRRQSSRYRAASTENKSPGNHFTIAETGGTAHEASGSPMDFSPQRYTPPDDTIRSMERNASKPAAWTRSAALDNDGLGDDEWGQFSETDVAMENLRKAASDLTFGSRPGSYSSIRGDVGSEREDQFVNLWRISTEDSKAAALGTNLQQDQNVIGGQKVPLISKDNTWSYVKMDAANQPESVVSSSTPSVDSSTSSSGWGHFTFTAGSSPSVPSTTSFLRRHARRIQGDRHARASSEANKATSSKSRGETVRSTSKGAQPDTAASESSDGSKEPLFSFDTRVHPSSESEKGFSGSGGWDRLQGPNATLTSRSTSASTESSSSFGSLPRADVQGSVGPQTAGAAATEQVCERWRLRGNQAYANGDFPKAEEYYSRGASSVPPNETSQSCIRASMLCYSNRAATRMVVGRMREALADCLRAMAVDPNFLRVRLRAASCHLALGESDSAALAFKECIRRAQEDGQQDTKVTTEASDGLRKAMQVEEYLGRVSEILANASSGDTLTALRLLNEVLLSSPHSERTLELKSRALLLLRRYDEVVQLCEQSLVSAERNHPLSCDTTSQQSIQAPYGGDGVKDPGALKVWRLRLTAKARFHLGRLEEALDALQNLEELASTALPGKTFLTDSSAATDHFALSPSTVRDLLRHKAAGNDAFQNGRHTEAVEHYSAALACNGDSRPFSAVCFCNRAAASQALGNVGDAISDCSRAIALDPKYAKAISRRATLHEKVRDYGQSCHDLQKFIALLESQEQQTRMVPSPVRVGTVTSNTQQDLRQAYERLAKAEEELKKGHPLDHYMILGLEPGCSSNEIKKAYRKAALRHHPDKAGQFLARSEGDDGAMWKEVADEVRHDAERLFKLIGEANAILSDPQKRSRYDAEEEFRKLRTRTSVAPSTFSEIYRRGGQGGGSRRPRYDSYSGYGHQYQRWQSGPDAAQPDTYARRGRCGSNNNSRSNGDGGSKNGSRSNGDGSHWSDYDWDEM